MPNVTISLSDEFLELIDSLKGGETRTRSNWIEHHLKALLDELITEGAAKKATDK